MGKGVLKEWTPPKESKFFRFEGQLYTIITALLIQILMRVLNRTKIIRKEIIGREKGPYIFASNHTTMFDSGFIDCLLFFKKAFASYDSIPYHTPEYGNFYKNRVMSYYMDRVKCLPLVRGKGIDQPSQRVVNEKLKSGKIVHIFPEGTRSRTGKLLPGKGGVGKRIYETKVKVVPCYHHGVRDILPVGSSIPKIGKKVTIIVGEPIYFDDLFELENKPETWRLISQRIMEHISKLRDEIGVE
ncbi:MAG: hypothetical protein CR982_03250 [Candidatus Cloacimonadota bacterium]|nr:MAG: hypothetical protein CR982_03250 [Candidatus Cloacimonadota bacterium]PIE77408.1 MAG: hypothetical protein CSA15_13080 [Candidatus Delongbacteria bacterium]